MIALMIAAAAACSGAPSLFPSAIVSKSLGVWVGIGNRGDHAVVACIHPLWSMSSSGVGTLGGGSPHECRSLTEKHLILPGSTLLMKQLSAKPKELRLAIRVGFSVTGFSPDGRESDVRIECTTQSIANNIEVSARVGSWAPLVVAGDSLFHLGLKNTDHAARVITELRPSSPNTSRMRCESGPQYIILPGDAYFQAAAKADVQQIDELSSNKCQRVVTFDFGSVPALQRPP